MKQEVTLLRDLPMCKAGTIGELFPIGSPRAYTFGFTNYTIQEIEQCPEFFKVETVYAPEDVEEGQYREDVFGVYRICTFAEPIMKDKFDLCWIDEDSSHDKIGFAPDELYEDKLLSTPEISSALIREAERRGYRAGQRIKRGWTQIQAHVTIPNPIFRDKGFEYYPKIDTLYLNRWEIYNSGVWADIIEQPKEEIVGYAKIRIVPEEQSPIPEMLKMLDELQSFVVKRQENIPQMQNKIAKVRSYIKNLEA
jgi:hypothetical protein